MDFSRALRLSRAAFGLSQAQFAKRLGVSASYLSLMESGKRKPSMAVVARLSDELGIPESLVFLLASTRSSAAQNSRDDLVRALLALIAASDREKQPALPFGD